MTATTNKEARAVDAAGPVTHEENTPVNAATVQERA